MDLLLIRHAEPVRIAPGSSTAPADPGLTARGNVQAERLARWLEHDPVDAVLARPPRRDQRLPGRGPRLGTTLVVGARVHVDQPRRRRSDGRALGGDAERDRASGGDDRREGGAGMSTVRTDHDGRVTVVTIDRPEVRNAVDRATADALAEAIRACCDDVDRDVAILTGAGGAFSPAPDLNAIPPGGPTPPPPHPAGPIA